MKPSPSAQRPKPAFERTSPEFQKKLRAVATEAKRDVVEVFDLWCAYCRTCDSYDQSPIPGEFLAWNFRTLGLTLQQAHQLGGLL